MVDHNKHSVFIAPHTPVASIILMVLSIAAKLSFGNFALYNCIFLISALLILAGMVLHRKNLQLLTGIGALMIALDSLYLLISNDLFLILVAESPTFVELQDVLIETLAIAAFTVSGLHYVLRKPLPGKTPKLILMIPLTCLWITRAFMHIWGITGIYPVKILVFYMSHCLMAFSLMVYTPFRKA